MQRLNTLWGPYDTRIVRVSSGPWAPRAGSWAVEGVAQGGGDT